jgi:hypothetical protein
MTEDDNIFTAVRTSNLNFKPSLLTVKVKFNFKLISILKYMKDHSYKAKRKNCYKSSLQVIKKLTFEDIIYRLCFMAFRFMVHLTLNDKA